MEIITTAISTAKQAKFYKRYSLGVWTSASSLLMTCWWHWSKWLLFI